MNGALALALLLSAGGGLSAPRPRPVESARYLIEGPEPWKAVRAVEGAGYRVVLASPDGRSLVATVEVDGAPFADSAPFPVDARQLPDDARALLSEPLPADDELESLSRMLLRGAATELEAVERVVAWVARRIRYDLPGLIPETAQGCHRSRRGSCVGRSLLAADLLRRGGVPVRQVTGILTARLPAELNGSSQELFNEGISGVRHRWIEVYVPGLGWVPSDPGGLANTVTARHLALPGPPPEGFGLRVLSQSPALERAARDGAIFRHRFRTVEAAGVTPGAERP